MADSHYDVIEVRFVIEPDATHAYVYMQALDDCPIGVQGWHHKAFPAPLSALEIMQAWALGQESPLLWPQQVPMSAVPEDNLRFGFGDEVVLTPEAVNFYKGKWPDFVPESQGGGGKGMVTQARYRGENQPGAEPRPYIVVWANGAINSYREADLDRYIVPRAAPVEVEAPQRPGFQFSIVPKED